MKKLLVLFSLILYVFCSSYVVHATTMVLPYMQVDAVMNMDHCDHGQTDTEDKSNGDCVDTCVGQYDELSSTYMFDLYKINTSIKYDFGLNLLTIDAEENCYIKNYPPPDFLVTLYRGYVGQITVLLI